MWGSSDMIVARRARLLSPPAAFTLVELLVSMSVLAILMVLVTQVVGQVQKTWLSSNSRVSQFREARMAFDLVTHNLAQAELNPYWETDTGGISSTNYTYAQRNQFQSLPSRYLRKSDLQFICGRATTLVKGAANADAQHLPFSAVFFQAALGATQVPDYERMQSLVCGRGYFVQYGDDAAFRPPFVTTPANRFRLMEYSPTSEQNSIYYDDWQFAANDTSGGTATMKPKWFNDAGATMDRTTDKSTGGNSTTAIVRGFTRPIAENIIAFVVAPRVSAQSAAAVGKDPHWIAPNYSYDSLQKTNSTTANPQGTEALLPPLVDVVMIAIDEASQGNFTSDDINSINGLFTNASAIDSDITAAQSALVNRGTGKRPINFRIFKTTVEIRAARWSL
jgi:uncharacterized protein (TIGR02599 family)